MNIRIGVLLSILAGGLVGSVHAGPTIPADMVGSYQGTLTFKNYNYMTGVTNTIKEPLLIVLSDKDAFNVSSGNSAISSGTGTFGVNNGVLPVSQPGGIVTFTLHYKSGKLKGLFTQYLTNSNMYFSEGKFSASKETP